MSFTYVTIPKTWSLFEYIGVPTILLEELPNEFSVEEFYFTLSTLLWSTQDEFTMSYIAFPINGTSLDIIEYQLDFKF